MAIKTLNENAIATGIIECAYCVYDRIGPGILEHVYEAALEHELIKRGMRVRKQVPLPVVYDDLYMDAGYRLDLIVEEKVVVEIKSVESLAPIHTKVLLTYLRLSGLKLGLLINFSVPLLKEGIKRVINGKIDG